MATLLIETLFHYRDQGEYKLHAFVVMRDHFHALLTFEGKGTIERVMQKIKGGFSYRARAELGFRGELWQRGFTEERVWDAQQFISVRKYIHDNPVRRGMVAAAEDYPFSSAHAKFRKPQGLPGATLHIQKSGENVPSVPGLCPRFFLGLWICFNVCFRIDQCQSLQIGRSCGTRVA